MGEDGRQRKNHCHTYERVNVLHKIKDEDGTLETVSRNIPGRTGRGLRPDTLPWRSHKHVQLILHLMQNIRQLFKILMTQVELKTHPSR